MDRKKLLKNIVFLMFLMFLANSVILKFHWYYSIWWIDMVMHFFGGAWVGLFFFYVFYTRKWFSNKILIIILSVLLIGISYEVFEFFLGTISREPFDILDTLSDLFFDLLGGGAAILYFAKRIMITEKNTV